MKNTLHKIVLFLSAFLFSWGYGQTPICINENVNRIVHNGTYPGVTATLNSLTPTGSGNNAATQGTIGNLIDNDLNSYYSLQSTVPSSLSNPGSINANFTIDNLDIKQGEKVNLKIGEASRLGGAIGETPATVQYRITTSKTVNGNTTIVINNVIFSPSFNAIDLADRIGNYTFITAQDIDKISIQVTASKPINAIASILGQTRLDLRFYGLYINPLCDYFQPTVCNAPVPLTTNNIGVSVDTGILETYGFINTGNIINPSTADFASSTVAGSVKLNLDKVIRAGTYTGFIVQDTDIASAVKSFRITTYFNGQQREVLTNTSLSINLVSNDRRSVGFVATQPYNQIKYELVSISVGAFNIYNAFILESCTTLQEFSCSDSEVRNKYVGLTQNKFAAIIDGGSTGVSGATAGVTFGNPEFVVDNDPNTSTVISIPAGGAVTASIGVKLLNQNIASSSEPFFAGFEFQTASLANISAVKNIVIEAYNGNNLVKTSETSGNIASLGALGNGSKGVVGILVDVPINRLVFKYTSLLNVDLGLMNVHRAVVKKFCEGSPLECNVEDLIGDIEFPVYIGEKTGIVGVPAAEIGSVNITNPEYIIDNDPATYAEFTTPASVAPTTTIQIMKALDPFPANTYATLDLEFSTSLVNVDALPTYRMQLYNNGTLVSEDSGESFLAGANILSSSRKRLGVKANGQFDEIRLIITKAAEVDLFGSTKIYDFRVLRACASPIECNEDFELIDTSTRKVVINEFRTGPTGIACVGCRVSNPYNLLTPSTTDYATLQLSASVGQFVGVSVLDLYNIYPSGTRVAFTAEDVANIIGADLLQGIFITTYLNGIEQERSALGQLIDLSILGVSIGNGKRAYAFNTTLPFNEVRFEVGSLVSINNTFRIYNVLINTSTSNGNDGNITCIQPCDRPATVLTGGLPTKVGISTLAEPTTAFPGNITNGLLALQSKDKGFVLTRVSNPNLITDPKEGMLIYDTTANCTKLYNGTFWSCLNQTCND